MKNGNNSPSRLRSPQSAAVGKAAGISDRVFGAVLAFMLAASAATEWLAIQLNNPSRDGRSHLLGSRHGDLPAVRGPCALEALRRQPPHQLRSSQGSLDRIWRDHRRRTLSGLLHLLVSLPHPRPQEHGQPDESAWLRNLGHARRHSKSSGCSTQPMAFTSAAGAIPDRSKSTIYCTRARNPSCLFAPAEAARASPPSFPRSASGGRASSSTT